MLRKYQQKAVADALATNNGILVLPTGSGKSHIIAELVRSCPGNSIILQPTKEILESNLEKVHQTGIGGIGVYSASMGEKHLGKSTYATIGTIIKIKDWLTDKIELLIVDECHLTNAKDGQYKEFIEAVNPKRLIGLTATPYRLATFRDHKSGESVSQIKMLTRTRPKIWKDIVHVTQSPDLIRDGYLVEPEFVVSGESGQQVLEMNTSGAEYTDASISRYFQETEISKRVADAADMAIERGLKHILVFVNSLEENEQVVSELHNRGSGISAHSISGKSPKAAREYTLENFRNSSIKAVVNVGVLTTGYDFPELDCIIGARPTMSLALYYQMIGRCVRPVNVECPVGGCRACDDRGFINTKTKTVVYDLVNNYARFGNPFDMLVVKGSTGLHSVMSSTGRLTGRNINDGPEMHERIEFGKYNGSLLKDVPQEYIEWYLTGKKSPSWHMFDSELLRRKCFKEKENA